MQHTPYDLENRLIDFAVRIIKVAEAIMRTKQSRKHLKRM